MNKKIKHRIITILEYLPKKITNSNAFVGFLILFCPVFLVISIMLLGQYFTSNQELIDNLATFVYPFPQILLMYIWLWYLINKLSLDYEVKQKNRIRYNQFCRLLIYLVVSLKTIVLIDDFIIGSSNNDLYSNILTYFGFLVVGLIFFGLLYGYYVLSSTMNTISKIKGKEDESNFVLFFFLPLTYIIIHKRIKKNLKPNASP